jgi:hypothetical protein
VLRTAAQFFLAADFLDRLYALRDQVLEGTPGGRRAIELYGRHQAEVRDLLVEDYELLDLALRSLNAWRPGMIALLGAHGESSVVSADQLATLTALFDRLAVLGSPELAATIARERTAIGLDSFAGLTMNQALSRLDRFRCEPNGKVQCAHGGRFRIETFWREFTGERGEGGAAPLTDDSGYFWFFDDANVELVTKIVDACDFTNNYWFFAGGLTNVEVRTVVTDTATGVVKTYRNPLGTPFAPILDTAGFETCQASKETRVRTPSDVPAPSARPVLAAAAGACVPSATELCLLDGRFEATLAWRAFDGRSGSGQALPLTPDSGTFWFFDPENVEIVVKLIDGCGLNDRFWVFATGLTNVDVELVVREAGSDRTWSYRNPLGTPFPPVLDISALDGCPGAHVAAARTGAGSKVRP